MTTWLIIALLFLGVALMFLAGLGILRMPDLFTRMHASTKGASLGVAMLMIAAGLFFWDLGVTTKAIITTVFIFLTAPVAAHLLGRAAYSRQIPLWENSIIDEARGHLRPGQNCGKESPSARE